jgi:TP901-1 family phage major tail protein
MPAQSGKDLLIKVDMDGTGLFETIAGLRATRLAFNAETVDVTSLDSTGGWRELLSRLGRENGRDLGLRRLSGCGDG